MVAITNQMFYPYKYVYVYIIIPRQLYYIFIFILLFFNFFFSNKLTASVFLKGFVILYITRLEQITSAVQALIKLVIIKKNTIFFLEGFGGK